MATRQGIKRWIKDFWGRVWDRRPWRRRTSGLAKAAEDHKRLLAVGARVFNNGDIEIQGVRFHLSYPTFKGALVENLYFEHYQFSLHGSWIVMDVGANAGATSLWLARHSNVKKVYAFEPVTPTYHMLLENLELNPVLKQKIETYPIGLGARKESVQVSFHPNHVMSASSKGTFDTCFNPTSIETIQIEAADRLLAPLLARHGQDRIFLKIDCEGAEYDILPNLAQAGVLKRVDVVIVEWHGGDVQALVDLLEREAFFCFIEWHRRDHWKIGMIKAVRGDRGLLQVGLDEGPSPWRQPGDRGPLEP